MFNLIATTVIILTIALGAIAILALFVTSLPVAVAAGLLLGLGIFGLIRVLAPLAE